MTDVSKGTLQEEVLNEKILSAIIEVKVPLTQAGRSCRPSAKSRSWCAPR